MGFTYQEPEHFVTTCINIFLPEEPTERCTSNHKPLCLCTPTIKTCFDINMHKYIYTSLVVYTLNGNYYRSHALQGTKGSR